MNKKRKITVQLILYILGFTSFIVLPKTLWHISSIVYFVISLLLTNIILNILLKEKIKTLILSSFVAPALFCIIFYLSNKNDIRIFKYLPIQYIYMFIYMLPLLIPVNYSINEITKLCRQKI